MTYIIYFFLKISMANELPYSCEQQLEDGIWPRDCFFYVIQEKTVLKSSKLFKKLGNWCETNKSLTLKKIDYKVLALKKEEIPSTCGNLISKSKAFHSYRDVSIF